MRHTAARDASCDLRDGCTAINVLITDADTGTMVCSTNIDSMRDPLQSHFTSTV